MRTAACQAPVPTADRAALFRVVITSAPAHPATRVCAASTTPTNASPPPQNVRMKECVSTPLAPTSENRLHRLHIWTNTISSEPTFMTAEIFRTNPQWVKICSVERTYQTFFHSFTALTCLKHISIWFQFDFLWSNRHTIFKWQNIHPNHNILSNQRPLA